MRSKSLDPATPLHVTLPRSLHRMVIRESRSQKVTQSALLKEIIRHHFEQEQVKKTAAEASR